jgi:hypothetical protein
VAYDTAKPPGEWVAAQARVHARLVRLLMGCALVRTPVICLDQRRDRAPYRSEGVWIICRTRLLAWIQVQRNRVLEVDRLAAFADRL